MSYLQRLKQAQANTGSRYSNLSGEPVAMPSASLKQINRTYKAKVVNGTNAAATYVVGGYNAYGDGNTAGSDTGITITTNVTGQGTHGALKREMNNMPSTLAACRISVTDSAQFQNSITYTVERGSSTISEVVEPLNSQAPTYNINTIIDIYEFAGMEWNGTTLVTGSLNSGVTLTFVFNIQAIVDMGNAAYGASVVKTTPLPPPIATNVAVNQAVLLPQGAVSAPGMMNNSGAKL